MNSHHRFLTLLFCWVATSLLPAQTSVQPWGIGIHPTAMLFLNAPDRNPGIPGNYELGIGISANRYLNPSVEIGIDVNAAQVSHPSAPIQADGSINRSSFYSSNLRFRYKFANGYFLKEQASLAPYLLVGSGLYYSASADAIQVQIPAGIGLRVRIDRNLHWMWESTFNVGIGDFGSSVQHSTGLILSFRGKRTKAWEDPISDLDNDGVPDIQDRCPETRGSKKGYGCPDRDGDGVFDPDDHCPDQFGFANLNGCADSDGDGIIDSDDFCPELFGTFDRRGCPFMDADGDQIADDEDDCPNLPGQFSAAGCPDDDGDGITNDQDNCPSIYGSEKWQGCPFEASKMAKINPEKTSQAKTRIISKSEVPNIPEVQDECLTADFIMLEVSKAIGFESKRSAFTNQSYPALERMLDFMKTCETGVLTISVLPEGKDPMFANTMAYSRALQIKSWLSTRGIDRERLITPKPDTGSSETEEKITLHWGD